MSDSEHDLYTPAQFGEYQRGHGHKHPSDVFEHTGTVRDPQVARYLDVSAAVHDPDEWDDPARAPGRAQNLTAVRRTIRMEGSETARTALDAGDMETLKHFTGDRGQQADVSGLKAIGEVDDLVTGPAPVIVVLGEPGAGKSNFASLLGQRWKDHHPSGYVASNIKSLRQTDEWTDKKGNRRDGYTATYGNLKEWLRHEGDPLTNDQTPKLSILDELSSKAAGTGKQGQQTRKYMAPLLYKIRKFGGALIAIAHGPKSVHPLLWRVGVIVKKVSQKKAVIAESITGSSISDVRGKIEGIPPTDWTYDDKEASSWAWTTNSEEDDGVDEIAVKKTAMWTMVQGDKDGKSPREIAENVPYSHSTVRNWLADYEEGGEKRSWISDVEAIVA